MQATNAAIESANQVAKDLAIRSAKAADRKRLSQKNNEPFTKFYSSRVNQIRYSYT